jgi:hypothetical protein
VRLFATVGLVLHVKVLLARLEQILNDGASRSQVLPQHDCGHHQVVAVFGLVDVDMASGHGMLLRGTREYRCVAVEMAHFDIHTDSGFELDQFTGSAG